MGVGPSVGVPPDVPVPDVAGFPRALAERVLKAAGFIVGTLDTLPAAGEAGMVARIVRACEDLRSAGTKMQ